MQNSPTFFVVAFKQTGKSSTVLKPIVVEVSNGYVSILALTFSLLFSQFVIQLKFIDLIQ